MIAPLWKPSDCWSFQVDHRSVISFIYLQQQRTEKYHASVIILVKQSVTDAVVLFQKKFYSRNSEIEHVCPILWDVRPIRIEHISKSLSIVPIDNLEILASSNKLPIEFQDMLRRRLRYGIIIIIISSNNKHSHGILCSLDTQIALAPPEKWVNTSELCEFRPSTMNKEPENQFACLDVIITYMDDGFKTSIYHKPTYLYIYSHHQYNVTNRISCYLHQSKYGNRHSIRK